MILHNLHYIANYRVQHDVLYCTVCSAMLLFKKNNISNRHQLQTVGMHYIIQKPGGQIQTQPEASHIEALLYMSGYFFKSHQVSLCV